MTEEYRDGEFEYGVVETLIEEIVDKYHLRAHIYLESDSYDNVLSTSMTYDGAADEEHDTILLNSLMFIVADLIKGKNGAERFATIAGIYEVVHEGIHLDDEEDAFDDEEDEEDEVI